MIWPNPAVKWDAGQAAFLRACRLARRPLLQTAEFIMSPRKLVVISFMSILAACANVPQTAEVRWAGIYTVSSEYQIPDSNSLTGKRNILKKVILSPATTHIPAVLGTHFGVSYILHDGRPNELVKLHAVVRYPQGGIMNTETGKSASSHEWTEACRVGAPCIIGFFFEEPWELTTGNWSIEMWQGSQQLYSQHLTYIDHNL